MLKDLLLLLLRLLLLLLLLLSLRSGSNYGPELLAYVLRRHAAPDSTPVRRESMKGVLFKVELGRSVQTKDRR